MYKKLLPLVNRFVFISQGYFNRGYEGKVLEVTPETLTIQAFDETGRPEAIWMIAIPTITECMVQARDLDELSLRVAMAQEPALHYADAIHPLERLQPTTSSGSVCNASASPAVLRSLASGTGQASPATADGTRLDVPPFVEEEAGLCDGDDNASACA